MRKIIKKKMFIFSAFIFGILISTYIKSLDSNKMYITLEDKKKIESQIEKTKKEVDKLKETKISYEKKLENYKEVMEDENKSIPDLMEDELNF